MNGHEGVVKILLGREEVGPDEPDSDGRTPLSPAAKSGHEGVVKTLLGREEANPDEPDNYCKTPLSFAADESGHEGAVKTLLGRKEVSLVPSFPKAPLPLPPPPPPQGNMSLSQVLEYLPPPASRTFAKQVRYRPLL